MRLIYAGLTVVLAASGAMPYAVTASSDLQTTAEAQSPSEPVGDERPPPPPPPTSGTIFRVRPVIRFPTAALQEEIEGRCTVRFTVDAEGVPQDIVPDCTAPVFDEAAREAVAATRIRMELGIAAGQKMALPLDFRIDAIRPPED